MISLRSHNRLREDSRLPAGQVPLPTLEERVATARRWTESQKQQEAARPQPMGVRRDVRRPAQQRQHAARGPSVSSVLDPVIERMDIGDEAQLADLRAFTAKMLAPRSDA